MVACQQPIGVGVVGGVVSLFDDLLHPSGLAHLSGADQHLHQDGVRFKAASQGGHKGAAEIAVHAGLQNTR